MLGALSTCAGATSLAVARGSSPPGMLVGVGSHQLHINCTGAGGPAVVFESGLGGSSLEWTKVQPEVSRFTRSCSYDRAGYGWSEPGPGPRHAGRLAAELETLLVYASVPPPYVLVGHSFGGLPVRLFAAQRNSAVAGLVLVDSTHEHQFQRLPAAGVRTPAAPTGRTFVIANHWALPEGLPAELRTLAQGLALRPKAVRALYGELSEMRASARQVSVARASGGVPVVVLARGEDADPPSRHRSGALHGTWLAMQRELATALSASLQVVPRSGHHIHLDRPGTVVAAIRRLVDAHRARPTP